MESTIAIYQLIILYLLHRAPKELPMVLLSNFMLENGYVNFETLAATYEELKANGYVTAREEADGAVFLSITEEGNETLFFFRNQISDSIKKQADDYLVKNGYSLTTDQSVTGEYYKASFGDRKGGEGRPEKVAHGERVPLSDRHRAPVLKNSTESTKIPQKRRNPAFVGLRFSAYLSYNAGKTRQIPVKAVPVPLFWRI